MSKLPWVLAASILTVGLFTPGATATPTVTVTLRVDASLTFPFDEPAFTAQCAATVDAGSNGSVILDAATCVDAWSHVVFPCCGRFVTGITGPGQTQSTDQRNLDNPCPGMVSYWSVWLNGAQATVGIDGYSAAQGDVLEFDYFVDEGCSFALSLASFFTNVDPDSPVPLSGPL